MGSTQFGKFHNFCRDSNLPVCNIFSESVNNGGPGFGRCNLEGIYLQNGTQLRNLGVILLAGLSVFVGLFFLWRVNRKKAAVGRREIQLFLLGYIVIELAEIFSVGGIPLPAKVVDGFTGVQIAAITATTWILLMNALVGYQVLEDGTALSLGLIIGSAAAIFIMTGYIVLDTAFSWSGHFASSLVVPNYNLAIYILYLLAPLVFLFVFFVLEAWLVVRVLGEVRPLIILVIAVLLFAIGQIFEFVISIHICEGTNGKIDGSLFQTFFTLLGVIGLVAFWNSITEDDWPVDAQRPDGEVYPDYNVSEKY